MKLREKSNPFGIVTVRRHPAGTIDRINALHAAGRHHEANQLLHRGKIATRQNNMIVFSSGCGYDILVQFLMSALNGSFSINNSQTLTCTTDGSTAVITGISSTAGLTAGMQISGYGIPPYSTVISIDGSTSLTISQNTTQAATSTLYFSTIQQLGIQWGEIGTGQTTPASTDTALTTPTVRAPISYALDDMFTTAQLQFFFPDSSLLNQTYYEFGTFVGGSSTIGSGNMFNHALFTQAYAKTAGTDTTVETDFTFEPASAAQFDSGEFT
jgi:hypothetical protein